MWSSNTLVDGWFYKIWEERFFKFILLQVRKNTSAIFSTQCIRIVHCIQGNRDAVSYKPLSHVLRNSGSTPETWDCSFPVWLSKYSVHSLEHSAISMIKNSFIWVLQQICRSQNFSRLKIQFSGKRHKFFFHRYLSNLFWQKMRCQEPFTKSRCLTSVRQWVEFVYIEV